MTWGRVMVQLVLLLALGCGGNGDARPNPPFAASFERLELGRTGALGTCAEPGTFETLVIEPSAAGEEYSATGTVWVAVDLDADGACPAGSWENSGSDAGCVTSEAVEPFAVELDAIAELGERLAAIPAPECRREPMVACDPCLIEELTVDGTEVSDAVCCADVADGFTDAFRAALDYLDALAPPPAV